MEFGQNNTLQQTLYLRATSIEKKVKKEKVCKIVILVGAFLLILAMITIVPSEMKASEDILRKLTRMFNSSPGPTGDSQKAIFRKMWPLTIGELERYWRLTGTNKPMIDELQTEYAYYERPTGFHKEGMRDKKNGFAQGPLREVNLETGKITEGTWDENGAHGLHREISADWVFLFFCLDNRCGDHRRFSHDFVEDIAWR